MFTFRAYHIYTVAMENSPSKFDPRGPVVPRGKPRKSLAEMLKRYEISQSGCWEWTATKNLQGYGVVGMYIGGRPVALQTHRLQWMHTHGEIPDGMVVMHICDNPKCLNPDHLVLGTQRANLADMRAKGRGNATGLKNFGQRMSERYKWST